MSFGSRSLPPPTDQERRRWSIIAPMGFGRCLTCETVGQIEHHHLLSGDVRIGHLFSVGLCPACHARVKTRLFKEIHGDNQQLLDLQNRRIGWPLVTIPARRTHRPERSKCVASAKNYPRPKGGLA